MKKNSISEYFLWIIKRDLSQAFVYTAIVMAFCVLFLSYFSTKNSLRKTSRIAVTSFEEAINAGDWDLASKAIHLLIDTNALDHVSISRGDGNSLIKKRNKNFFSVCLNQHSERFSYILCKNFFSLDNVFISLFLPIVLFILFLISKTIYENKVITFFKDISNEFSSINKLDFSSTKLSEIKEIKETKENIKRLVTDLKIQESNRLKYEVTKQIAHDIRSPLEALRSVTGHIDDLDFQHRKIITSSIQRISDIANGLLREGKATEKLSLVNLNILLDELYQDKIFEHGSKIKFDNKLSYKESFINGDENILYRIFSNLINNAFESYDSSIGDVVILLESKASDVIIKVQDFGKGMSQELIEKVLEGGITTKEKGNGLGVSSAFEEIKKCHGTFEIDSEVGTGTTVIIKLSKLKAPSWFADSIEINNNVKKIICVDDDPGFLEVYQEKLKGFGDRLNCIHPKNLTTKNFSKESQYFFDYDLGKNEKTGLDIILENEIKANSTLVTSMYQDENIQKVCLDNGIKILPKQIFNNVKVNIVKDECLKIVFIDDDEIMHLSWNMEASKKNIAIKTYFKVEDFLKEAEQHSLETKIFIDSDLGDGVKGEVESKKIFDLGFTEIFLATGYSPQDIEKPDWIKKVVGKRPAF